MIGNILLISILSFLAILTGMAGFALYRLLPKKQEEGPKTIVEVDDTFPLTKTKGYGLVIEGKLALTSRGRPLIFKNAVSAVRFNRKYYGDKGEVIYQIWNEGTRTVQVGKVYYDGTDQLQKS